MKQNKKRYFGIFTMLAVVIAVLFEALVLYELRNYENGFLELYAMEQDGYVQVTVDQIKRLDENATEDDITEIISSIDASSSMYWTVNTGDNILFIKSITETNRYKNYTPETYYNSESAIDFVNKLSVGKVSHDVIFLEQERYVVSGALFEWQGKEYRICLLTYDKAILDKNEVMQAKYSVIVVVSLVLAVSLIFILFMVKRLDEKNAVIYGDRNKLEQLYKQLEHLEHAYRMQDTYSAATNLFAEDVLVRFLNQLDAEDVLPLTFAMYDVKNAETKKQFLLDMQLILNKTVLRFQIGEDKLLLIFSGFEERQANAYATQVVKGEVKLLGTKFVENNLVPYTAQYKQFEEEVLHE